MRTATLTLLLLAACAKDAGKSAPAGKSNAAPETPADAIPEPPDPHRPSTLKAVMDGQPFAVQSAIAIGSGMTDGAPFHTVVLTSTKVPCSQADAYWSSSGKVDITASTLRWEKDGITRYEDKSGNWTFSFNPAKGGWENGEGTVKVLVAPTRGGVARVAFDIKAKAPGYSVTGEIDVDVCDD